MLTVASTIAVPQYYYYPRHSYSHSSELFYGGYGYGNRYGNSAYGYQQAMYYPNQLQQQQPAPAQAQIQRI
uniref:Uncharacterized protein n=1 Tax=Syphacia muris TaxID=451379 RepID=A0A0N5AUR8_9BILA